MARGPSTVRRGLLVASAAVAVLVVLAPESRGSEGLKPPAEHPRALGRGGAGIAFGGNALDVLTNPAGIAWVPRHQLQFSGNLLQINAVYEDSRNPGGVASEASEFPYPSFCFVFDPGTISQPAERRLLYPGYDPTAPRPLPLIPPWTAPFGQAIAVARTIHVPVVRFPSVVEVSAVHAHDVVSAFVHDVSVVAHYGDHHPLVATSTGAGAVRPVETIVARLAGFPNPVPRQPDAISVSFLTDLTFTGPDARVDLTVRVDGVPVGSARVGPEDAAPPPSMPPAVAPPEMPEPSNMRIGFGFFVQSGAGSDTQIQTILYPEGIPHKSNFSLVSLTPTFAWDLDEWGAVGIALHLNYGKLFMRTPVTQAPSILAGQIFPTGSLQAAFGAAFGIPTAFGPAMQYVFDTNPLHGAGTSITHVDHPDDDLFSRLQGGARLTELDSFGIGGQIGYILRVTDRLRVGATYKFPTYMGPYRGRAQVDFNRQIDAYRASATQAHSDEVSILGIPTELRFTFTQIFDPPGTVDVFIGGVLAIPAFPVPGGSISQNLPNGGANGFAGTYDAEVEEFTMPPELGLGLAYDLTDWLTLALDYKHIFWSQTMNDFTVTLTNGSNPDVNALVGSDTLTVSVPLDWKDQDVIALGMELRPWDAVTLRAGGAYGNNPIPSDVIQPLLPASTTWHVGGGFSVAVSEHTSLDFGFMYALPETVHVRASRFAPDLDGSDYTVEQTLYMGGVTLDW